jgi:hypothetical protein
MNARKIKTLKSLDDFMILQSDTASACGGIPQILGDGYLCQNNQFFRAIRAKTIELGFQFDAEPPFPYTTFPLLSLSKILKTKIIPITENVSVLADLARARPGVFNVRDFQLVVPAKNFMIHESAHCIADTILKPRETEKIDLIKIMLGEAFANSTELMAPHFSPDTPIDRWILAMNTYFSVRLKDLPRLVDELSSPVILKLSIVLFLYSNFLFEDLTKAQLEKIFDFIGISNAIRKTKRFEAAIIGIRKIAFGLDPFFRLLTTEVYLKSIGFKNAPARLLSFDPIRFIEKNPEVMRGLDRICEVAP